MGTAETIGGVTGELRAPRGFARLAARNRRRVKEPQPVAEGRRLHSELGDDARDRRRERPQALVIARLLGQVGEEVAQAPASEGKELAVVGDRQEHLRDGQCNELGVSDLRRPARPSPHGQEIIDPHVKCGDEGVKVGEHEASLVDVALATPSFGALVMSPRRATRSNSESTI